MKTQTIVEKIGRSPDKSDSAVYFYRALQVKGMALNEWLDAGAFLNYGSFAHDARPLFHRGS